MWHLAAFFKAIGQTALTDIPAIQDDILTIQNGHFLLGANMNVGAAYVGSATLSRARLNSPTVRQMNPSYIHPINVALLPINDPPVQVFPPGFLALMAQEELQMEATSGLAMGTENLYGLAWLYTQLTQVGNGDIHWCRLTSVGPAVASVWQSIQYNFETGLPPGEYAMVSSFCGCATGVAHRWIFDNQYFRPGFLSFANSSFRGSYEQYHFNWGEMGRFRTFAAPRLQVLCNAADASFEIYIAVQRVGP